MRLVISQQKLNSETLCSANVALSTEITWQAMLII
jgi:hypothetical protein